MRYEAPVLTAAVVLGLILGATCLPLSAQKKTKEFEDAQARSQEAARFVELLGALPNGALPQEVTARAQAVAVFPKVTNQSALIMQAFRGHGVISARTEDGWTPPAFFRFVGGGTSTPFARNKTRAILVVFMTKDAVGWFEKDGIGFAKEKKAIEGPVGPLSDEQRLELQNAQILAYEYANGTLTGKGFGASFWKTFGLNPDNKINQSLYGIKGRDVLFGAKTDQPAEVPEGTIAFRQALQKHFGPQ